MNANLQIVSLTRQSVLEMVHNFLILICTSGRIRSSSLHQVNIHLLEAKCVKLREQPLSMHKHFNIFPATVEAFNNAGQL